MKLKKNFHKLFQIKINNKKTRFSFEEKHKLNDLFEKL
jgi:hypothetical protein